jgi:hypothetical protein
VVAPNGSAAFIAGGSQRVVGRMTPAGGEQLDAGPLVEPESLALAGDARLYWFNGVPRSAQLDDEPLRFPAATSFGGHERCYPRKSKTRAASTVVRVYTRYVERPEYEPFTEYVACDLRSGRRTVLESFSDPDTSFQFDQIRAAGSFAGYAGFPCSKYGCNGGFVRVIDSRTGRELTRAFPGSARGVKITVLALRADGTMAWSSDERGFDGVAHTPTVNRCTASGCATVDEGKGIDAGSLAPSEGSRLYWMRDGAPRAQ